ncbi:hypothetical protein HpBGD133_16290 [Helicobacter pylori]
MYKRQISAFLQLELEEFSQKYVKKVGYKFSLLEKDAKEWGLACVFLDLETKKCQIYSCLLSTSDAADDLTRV